MKTKVYGNSHSTYSGCGNFGGGFQRGNSAVKKGGGIPPPPPAKFSRCVPTTSLRIRMQGSTADSDVQRCTGRREGTEMYLFATCGGWNALKVMGAIQSPLGMNSKL